MSKNKLFYPVFLSLYMLFVCSCNSNPQGVPMSTRLISSQVPVYTSTIPMSRSSGTPLPLRTLIHTPTIEPLSNLSPDLTVTDIWTTTATQAYKDLRHIPYAEEAWSFFRGSSGRLYNNIYSIAIASDQDVWFSGLSGYLLHFNGDQMISYTLPISASFHNGKFLNLIIDADKNVWVAAGKAGVFCFDGQHWRQYTSEQGLPEEVDYLLISPDKKLWAVRYQSGSIYRFTGRTWEFYWSLETALNQKYDTVRRNRIYSATIDPGGTFWISDGSLSRLDHLNWTLYPTDVLPYLSGECRVSVVKAAPDGSLWSHNCIARYLIHFKPGKYHHVLQIPGLDNRRVANIGFYIAPDSGIWSGINIADSPATYVLMNWDGKIWTMYDGFPTQERNAAEMFNTLAVTNNGTVWITTKLGIYRYKP